MKDDLKHSKEAVLRELYMLTGQVTKDATYLYYLLIKDGCYFKEKKQEEIKDECTVPSFEEWFNALEV